MQGGRGVDVVVANDEVCGLDALAAGEAGGGFCGLAVGVEGAVGGRAAALDSFVLLAGTQVLHMRHEAAGCAGDGNGTV